MDKSVVLRDYPVVVVLIQGSLDGMCRSLLQRPPTCSWIHGIWNLQKDPTPPFGLCSVSWGPSNSKMSGLAFGDAAGSLRLVVTPGPPTQVSNGPMWTSRHLQESSVVDLAWAIFGPRACSPWSKRRSEKFSCPKERKASQWNWEK